MNSITGSTCRAKCSNILHDTIFSSKARGYPSGATLYGSPAHVRLRKSYRILTNALAYSGKKVLSDLPVAETEANIFVVHSSETINSSNVICNEQSYKKFYGRNLRITLIMFVLGKLFQHSLMPVGKDRECPRVEQLKDTLLR